MDDVNFKDIRVLPGGLGLKGNNARTLADLLPQLQGSSVLKGLVVGTTGKGEIIFHTGLGRFISPNPMGLGRGDTITIRLAREGEQLGGAIVKINNSSPELKEAINLVFAREGKPSSLGKPPTLATSVALSIKNDDSLGGNSQTTTIKGSISYLNLSKLDSNSALYKTLSANLKPDANSISFKITNNNNSLNAAFQINGQVVSESQKGSQLIRTDFGMVTTKNTNIPNGQNLLLEITSINNTDVSSRAKEVITKFIFDLNQNWQVMKKLDQSQYVAQNTQTSKANINLLSPNMARASSGTQTLPGSISLIGSMPSSNDGSEDRNNTLISPTSSRAILGKSTNTTQLHTKTVSIAAERGSSYPIQASRQIGQIGQNVSSSSGTTSKQGQAQISSQQVSSPASALASNNTTSSNILSRASSIPKDISHSATSNASPSASSLPNAGSGRASEYTSSIQNMSTQTNSSQQSRSIEEIAIMTRIGLQNNLIAINSAESSDLLSSLRLNSRKLRSNLKQEFLEEEGIDLERGNIAKLKSEYSAPSKGLNNMSANLHAIKEMFNLMDEARSADENQWQNFFLPIYYDKEVFDQEISVQKKKDGSLRFLIDTTFESFGDIQLDGFITFKNIINKSIKSFDLVVRSKNRIDSDLFRTINKIYTNSSQITGIDGNLQFDENSRFAQTSDNS